MFGLITKYISLGTLIVGLLFGYWICYVVQEVNIKQIKIVDQAKQIDQQSVQLKNKDSIIAELNNREIIKESFIKALRVQYSSLETNYENAKSQNFKYAKRIDDSNRINVAWVRASLGKPIKRVSTLSKTTSRTNDQRESAFFTQYISNPSELAKDNAYFRLKCYEQQAKYFLLIDFNEAQ